MDTTIPALPYRHALVPAYALAIFDDSDDTDSANDTKDANAGDDDGGGSSQGAGDKSRGNADKRQGQSRDRGGRFTIPDTNDAGELRRALETAQGLLTSAHDRIGELNAENSKHRLRANGLENRLNAADQRVIRAEARDALTQAGAISPRIVDLFLADHADKVKIDAKTGEPVGIQENIEAWKTANADFFKPATGKASDDQQNDGAGGDKSDEDGKSGDDKSAKPNRTGTGASTRGAATDSGNSGGMPDLRSLDPKQRAAAVRAYQQSLRGNRNG